jgi:hypothetical protein
MPSPRSFSAVAALALAVGLVSCSKPKDSSSNAPLVIKGSNPDTTPPSGGDLPPVQPQPAVEKIQVTAAVSNVSGWFDAVKEINTRWMPDADGDIRAEIQAGLLQAGFSPSFLDNIELGGLHAMWLAYPIQGSNAGAADVNLAATVAVKDGRKVIEGAPASARPQPLGDGMWELASEDGKLFIREAGKELLLGMSPDDVAKAGKLRADAKVGHGLEVKVWNIPKDDLDPAALFGLPADSSLAKNLAGIVKELGAIQLSADLGVSKDGTALVSAEAPFSRLGIDPIGKARTSATALEGRLPGDPMLVTTMSWGDPALLERTLNEQIPVAQIPEPFGGIVRQAIGAATSLLGQVANDVVFGVWVDGKGKMTAIVAADIEDEAKTREAMRVLADAIRAGVEAQQALAGKDKSAHIGFEFKKDAVSGGATKGDRMVLKAPKEIASEVDELAFFLDKGALETISFTKDKTAFVVMGTGAKTVATNLMKGKASKTLAQHDGLADLRKSMGGCQICMTFDPVSYLRFRLAFLAAKDKSAAKQVKVATKDLQKVGSVGAPGLGIRVEPKVGALGVSVPSEALFANKDAVATLQRVSDLVHGGSTAAPPAVVEPAPAQPKPAPKKAAPKKPKKDG